jgi:hypothetical protein
MKALEADNILIRGTNWIGDAVMTLPAVFSGSARMWTIS